VDQALRKGAAFRRVEADYQTPAGERRVLGITLSPVRTAAGDTLGAACLVSDLTEITTLARQVRLREFEATMSGGFYLTGCFDEIAEHYEIGRDLFPEHYDEGWIDRHLPRQPRPLRRSRVR